MCPWHSAHARTHAVQHTRGCRRRPTTAAAASAQPAPIIAITHDPWTHARGAGRMHALHCSHKCTAAAVRRLFQRYRQQGAPAAAAPQSCWRLGSHATAAAVQHACKATTHPALARRAANQRRRRQPCAHVAQHLEPPVYPGPPRALPSALVRMHACDDDAQRKRWRPHARTGAPSYRDMLGVGGKQQQCTAEGNTPPARRPVGGPRLATLTSRQPLAAPAPPPWRPRQTCCCSASCRPRAASSRAPCA